MRNLPADATPNLGLPRNTTCQRVLLVCGEDPETVEAILDERSVIRGPVIHHREFHTGPCKMGGVSFTCCVTGIGSASVEIAMSELFATGGRVFIHAGTAASLHPSLLPVGAPVIVEAVVRDDGASLHYLPGVGHRVSCHPEVLAALERASDMLGRKVAKAVGVSSDAFYAGGAIVLEGLMSHGSLLPLRNGLIPVAFATWLLPLLENQAPYCLDMEVATVYTLASLVDPVRDVRWGSIKGVSNVIPFVPGEQNEQTEVALAAALEIALVALTLL